MNPDNIFGNYQIVRLLGRGGQGNAYEAVVLKGRLAGRHVALKVMAKDVQGHGEAAAVERAAIIKRLRSEARVTKQLEGPNIAQLLDFGAVGDVWYLVFELVEGASLWEVMALQRDKCMDPDLVTFMALGISTALATAHGLGIIHRDLKPANVMVSEDGQVKLIDFGMAKSSAIGLAASAYTHGIGTDKYWAPEQVVWDAKLGPQTDIFALGTCMFQMLSGHLPFYDPSNEGSLERNLVEGNFVHTLDGRGISDDLVAITMGCLQNEFDRRFANGAALRNALLASLEGEAPQNELAGARLGAQAAIGKRMRNELAAGFESGMGLPEGSYDEAVGDRSDDPYGAPTVLDAAHRRVTRAVDTAALAAQAADAIPDGSNRNGEDEIKRELDRMAKEASEQQAPAPDATNPRGRKKRATTPGFLRPVDSTDTAVTKIHARRLPKESEAESISADQAQELSSTEDSAPAAARRDRQSTAVALPSPKRRRLTILAAVAVAAGVTLAFLWPGGDATGEASAAHAPAIETVLTAAAKPEIAHSTNPPASAPSPVPPVDQADAAIAPVALPAATKPPEPQAPRKESVTAKTTKPKRASGKRVNLKIGAIPRALIFVDGKRIGMSPVTTRVSPGAVRVVAKINQLRRAKRITVPNRDYQHIIDMRDAE